MTSRILFLVLVIGCGLFGFSGCDSVDSKLDVPDGRNSPNERYQDDDIIGPVLKLHRKESSGQKSEQPDLLHKQPLNSDL